MLSHEFFSKLCLVRTIVLFIIFAFILIIPGNAILLISSNNNYFGTTGNFAYGQQQQPKNQMNSNNITNSLDIQSIPAKKVHVGDIDIAYKTFGKGEPILLVSGAGGDMNGWEPSTLKVLSSNHHQHH